MVNEYFHQYNFNSKCSYLYFCLVPACGGQMYHVNTSGISRNYERCYFTRRRRCSKCERGLLIVKSY